MGSSPQAVIDEVRGQLTRLLSLSECRFQDGAAGIGHPPRLLRSGQVVTRGRVWDAGREGLPGGTGTELLAEAGGLLQGRFLLTPVPGCSCRWNSGLWRWPSPIRLPPHWRAGSGQPPGGLAGL